MFMQDAKPMDLQSFLAAIMAISIAVERVIEILKQTVGAWPIVKWLFTANPDAAQDSWRCAVVHLLSAALGSWIAKLSQTTVPWIQDEPVRGYLLIGLLSAAGSAFWNHALDLVKATKVQQEQAAKVAVATTSDLAKAVHL